MNKVFLLIPFVLILFFGVSFTYAESLIPDWVKNTALWYGQGIITEQEYLESLKYLINNKIIFLDEQEKNALLDPTITSTDVTVTKPRINQCSILYQSYKNIGKPQFVAKYDHVNFINICVKLYQDPVWKYQGDDRLEKLNEKFLEFNQKAKNEAPKLSFEPTVKILSTTNIGKDKFDVKFNICAGDQKIDKAKVLVKSKIESIQVGSDKDIPSNVCRTYVTQIHANNVANIQITILEQVLTN
ncbi:plastocyanin [Nitrosopumilus cobalaminigenes]|uniref:Plastocyanin n=1 Tax=Nitrosopumilus cobalaminigenes TaxID=1470066 RepID=A0A7D5M193_9ARCH|nr:plastocyanin [Nitrosopumilus cobalaminigenes]QLH03335.1 plastocyanin [Nitrosopumilus cobalaminigenes]